MKGRTEFIVTFNPFLEKALDIHFSISAWHSITPDLENDRK
jgi:hypothetical protein